ncbi:hypothetical protein FGO68_gene10675 [Halteria grandinella]|uniref:Transmembrane protein n=1 Tax=Halteria grandinella TaxID=5974 RepID=A0A8J8T0C8_HALGN|nr:hypothetical protein FGO68_gene10675 [Halteria grandinella]
MRSLINEETQNDILIQEPKEREEQEQQDRFNHVEKVHYQIEVDDAVFIDRLIAYASKNNGCSPYEDSQGRKYIFYPVYRKKGSQQMEMCLVHETGCDLKDRISYFNGEDSLKVSGKIIYVGYPKKLQQVTDIQGQNLKNFIVFDNFQDAINDKATKPQIKALSNHKIPYYITNSETELMSVNQALSAICTLLKKENQQSIIKSRYVFAALIFYLLFLGVFTNALLYFYLVMERYQWDFKLISKILIYLGFLIVVCIQDAVVLGSVAKLSDVSNKCLEKMFQLLIVILVAFKGLVLEGLSIWKLVKVFQSDPMTSNLNILIPIGCLIAPIPFSILVTRLIEKDTWESDRKKKINNFKKFRLNF